MVTWIKIHYLISDTLVETNDDYPFDEFPIIPMQWEPIPQSPYGIPLLRGLTVPQKVANLIESAANNVAMHYSTPTWIVSEESGLDIDKVAKLSNALGMVWKVNGDAKSAISQMPYPEVNEEMISIKENFVQNIKNYAGISDTYIGNIGTAGSTAEGTNTAVNRATVIDNSPINQIEKYVGYQIQVAEDEVPTLPKNTYYFYQLEGLRCFDEEGNEFGYIKKVEDFTSQTSFRILLKNNKTILIPFVEFYVKKIDLENKKFIIHLFPGILD